MDKQKFQLWCTLQKKQMQQNNDGQISQLKVLFTQGPAKCLARLHICAVSPEPSLFAHFSMEADEGSDQKSDIWPYWMAAAHACLKNEFMEDKKLDMAQNLHLFPPLSICYLLYSNGNN